MNKMLKCYILVGLLVAVIALPENEFNYTNEFVTDGVKLENHRVVTKDLFILGVRRLQNINLSVMKKKHSVLLLHGISASSDRFIEHGRNLSLAYSLADAGFDVWLGNVRGNKYSRHHIYLNTDDPVDKMKFFNYTYEDIGQFDIPAIVNYILEQTDMTKLHFIGHCQGGTAFLALNSLQPEISEKFASAHLLAPVAYQKHFSNPVLRTLSKVADTIYKLLLDLGIVELFPDQVKQDTKDIQAFEGKEYEKCLGHTNFKDLCEILYTGGLLGKYRGNRGAIKQLIHFAQNIHSQQFKRWDHGVETNLQIYGTEQPPDYNLSLVTVYTVIHYGLMDHLVSIWDVLEMANDMPNVHTRAVAREDFEKSEFLDAPDAAELIYEFIIDALSYFENKTTTTTPYETAVERPPKTNDSGSTASVLNEALFMMLLTLKYF